MSGQRRAALALHGLAPADRDWMLARLPEPQADQVRALLDELESLGIPADPAFIEDAIASPRVAAPKPVPWQAHGMALSAAQAHAVLAGEPDALVAIVLSASTWPWRADFLARLPDERAERLRDIAGFANPGPALREAVLDTFAGRATFCADEAPGDRPARPASAPARLTGRLAERWRAWTR